MKQLTHRSEDQISVNIGASDITVGEGNFLLIAGPCSVESRDGLLNVARSILAAGAGMLRGGVWKPRTSHRSFQGLGEAALELLSEARAETGLPVVTEVLDPRHVEVAANSVDALQIGTRNMSNAVLLREVARSGLPIVLKRGFGATIEEFLDAAEYILAEGNERILLVERGIRTFETSTRFTLDISAIPVLRGRTHLPIIVDPSHAAGHSALVPALGKAAAAAGADGLLVEVHDDPSSALSDGAQALTRDGFAEFVSDLDRILTAVNQRRCTPRLAANVE